MARLAVGAAFGIVVGTVFGAALGLHADEPTVAEAAAMAQVDPQDLAGAVATTGLPPFEYLRAVGELPGSGSNLPPSASSSPAAPTSGVSPALAARVACIERAESGGANVANARGSGASGVMQYMPSTFAAHAREMGHPEWSLWNPAQARAVAAHDLALGRRSQWSVGGC